jgi:hypothetical protein
MAGPSATISDLQIRDHQLFGRISVVGGAGEYGTATLVVYDAGGTERYRSDLGRMDAGQPWDLQLDIHGSGLEDGDYGAWIWVALNHADGSMGDVVQEGVSFLVGRGQVYPSREPVDRRDFDTPVEPSNMRLEGSWVVFDMKNTARFDVEVAHSFGITNDTGTPYTAHGEELVRAGATQQGHYLMPEQIPDGTYFMMVVVQAQGSDGQLPISLNIEVRQGVVTVTP